jgi:hypothetical protein
VSQLLPATAIIITTGWAVITWRRAVRAWLIINRRWDDHLIARLVINRWRWRLDVYRLLYINRLWLLDIDSSVTTGRNRCTDYRSANNGTDYRCRSTPAAATAAMGVRLACEG